MNNAPSVLEHCCVVQLGIFGRFELARFQSFKFAAIFRALKESYSFKLAPDESLSACLEGYIYKVYCVQF